MNKTREQRRREAKNKAEAKEKSDAKLSRNSKAFISPLALNTTGINGQDAEKANQRPQKKAKQCEENKPGKRKTYTMSAVLSLVFISILSVISFAFAFHYWQQDNWPVLLRWGFVTYVFIGLGIAFAIRYYVIEPKDAAKTIAPTGRPIVFIKRIALDEDLAVGKTPTITLILANSGPMEAEVRLWNCTSYFEAPSRRGPFPAYAETAENVFKLAPTGEAAARIWMPNLKLKANEIKQIIEGKANLYFFAQGEYRDELGRVWDFPFCRIYHPQFPGNLMNCPAAFPIEDSKKHD